MKARIYITPNGWIQRQWTARELLVLNPPFKATQLYVCQESLLWSHSDNHDHQLPFHGDLVILHGEGQLAIARFYGGSLEWIRLIDELSQTHRDLFGIEMPRPRIVRQ